MGTAQHRPILITGGGRRIGLALAHHFLNLRHPVIVSYRTEYPSIDGLRKGQPVFRLISPPTTAFLPLRIRSNQRPTVCGRLSITPAHGLQKTRYVAQRNARLYAADPRQCPYLLNHALQDLLRGHGHAAGDIIHFTDYVVERGSDKHIAYAASKAALDNMTRSFARKLAPEVKVNAIAPAMILFNEGDDAEYRQQALNKSLMKIAPARKR